MVCQRGSAAAGVARRKRRPLINATPGARARRCLCPLPSDEAADLCRQCHRLAPFCNFNGNTFAAIARSLVDTLRLKADEAHILRSLAGHIVAGTASDAETKAFAEFSRSLTEEQLKKR